MTKPIVLDTHELAWAAGFFDGEGCTFIRRHDRASKRTGETRSSLSPGITIVQAEPGAGNLRRFQEAVGGIGRIVGPLPRPNPKHQPRWEFQATTFQEVQAVVAMLWKNLSDVKQDQAAAVLRSVVEAVRFLNDNPVPFVPRTTCRNGHFVADGGKCKACQRQRSREYRARKKQS